MNAPIGHAVQIIHSAAPVRKQSSTEEMHAVLNQLLGISARESELANRAKYGEPPLTPAEQDELEQLRQAREAKHASH